MMRQFEVTFDVLVEARTDSFLGASRSDMQNRTMVVPANDPNNAQRMIEAMFGRQNVVVKSAYPVN
jgi:hypothetical protein